MDELSDNSKLKLPQQFNDIPNNVIVGLGKLVITCDEFNARAAARKAEMKKFTLREPNSAERMGGYFSRTLFKRVEVIQEEMELEKLSKTRADQESRNTMKAI